ncbi:hypothetical protein Tco_0983599 [Tanacetum coccineum]
MKEQFDAVTSQIATLTLEIQTAKASRWTRHEAGNSDQGIPRSMRLDVPKFNGSDPDTWILAINEHFLLLETTPEQRLRIIGFNMEGDATEWYRWMTRNKLKAYSYRFTSLALQQELLVSKPTALGEAFSLARVTEARLDD